MNDNIKPTPIYVILGMHKSGTTIIADACVNAGIDMGVPTIDGTEYDYGIKGEAPIFQEINKEILQCHNNWSADIREPADSANLERSVEERAMLAVSKLEKARRPWGFKDPRTILTYDIWANLLPSHHILAVFRDPAEVMENYGRQAAKSRVGTAAKYPLYVYYCYKGVVAWIDYNEILLSKLSSTPYQITIFRFDRLFLSNEERERLSKCVGGFGEAPVKTELYRSKRKSRWLFHVIRGLVRIGNRRDPETIYSELIDQWERNKQGEDIA